MTGQVKEDLISKFREIGIKIKSGKKFIYLSLLTKEEFLEKEEIFTYFDLTGKEQNIKCRKNSVAIIYCQVPFIYKLSDTEKLLSLKKMEKKLN